MIWWNYITKDSQTHYLYPRGLVTNDNFVKNFLICITSIGKTVSNKYQIGLVDWNLLDLDFHLGER